MSTMPVKARSELLNVEEAAKVLGCTGARVRQMLIDGDINGYKASEAPKALWLIPRSEVDTVAKRERRRGGRPRIGD